MKQSKNWTFTDYEFLDWEDIYKQEGVRYICWGNEICPDTKRKHLQGWIQCDAKKRLSEIKKVCRSKQMHMEPCEGTEAQNDKYCQKDNIYKTLGKYIVQGERTDLNRIKEIIDSGGNMEDIANSNFKKFIMYNRGFQAYKKIIDKRLRKGFRKVKTIIIHGKTGTGKTRLAMEQTKNGEIFKIQGKGLKWWDGYEGEKTILIDEYANDIPITELLGILDGYQLRLEIKGSFTYANWTQVIITTNLKKLHNNEKKVHKEALKRRIHKKLKVC